MSMKTIDEVIDVFEKEIKGSAGVYDDDLRDAILYLKMYRSDKMQFETERKHWDECVKGTLESAARARETHIAAVRELKGKQAELEAEKERY